MSSSCLESVILNKPTRRNQSGGDGGKAYGRDDGGCGTPVFAQKPNRKVANDHWGSFVWERVFHDSPFSRLRPSKNYFSHYLGICASPGDVPKRANTESYANKATLLLCLCLMMSTVFMSRELESVILFDFFYWCIFGKKHPPPPKTKLAWTQMQIVECDIFDPVCCNSLNLAVFRLFVRYWHDIFQNVSLSQRC